MKCPKDGTELVEKSYKRGLIVDECPQCNGMWLDANELDELEDQKYNEDEYKGSLVHREVLTKYPCPHCGQPLHEFQYRLRSLMLDYCLENGHGFWLDSGESERVLQLMDERKGDIKRKFKAEAEFQKMLQHWRRKSFIDKLRDLLK
jgi:Zn-finger nucleic acid-binding protein